MEGLAVVLYDSHAYLTKSRVKPYLGGEVVGGLGPPAATVNGGKLNKIKLSKCGTVLSWLEPSPHH